MAKVNITREPGESEADFRRRYHRAWEDQDRRERGIPPRATKGPCSVDGCDRLSEAKGMCGKHYRAERVRRLRAEGQNPLGEKQAHPLYRIWWERRVRNSLCEEWAADFWVFVAAVGDRPSPSHLLRRLSRKQPYRDGNWEWIAALKRQPEESRKDFNARKWASRRQREPAYEIRRWLVRTYGITADDYARMLEEQGGVCATCKNPETATQHTTGAVKALAVDHCHTTGKVRGLLCWRCNAVLGKVRDSTELLREMAAYLERA